MIGRVRVAAATALLVATGMQAAGAVYRDTFKGVVDEIDEALSYKTSALAELKAVK